MIKNYELETNINKDEEKEIELLIEDKINKAWELESLGATINGKGVLEKNNLKPC